MAERGWRDRIVGDRMQVDQEFAGAVQASGFTRTEWGMIMTAVEFEVAGEGDSAELVADTSKVDDILPELEKVTQRMGGYPPEGAGGGGRSGGGLLDGVRSALGLGGGGIDPERRREAVELVERYARTLQRHLEDRGRWQQVRELAAAEDGGTEE